MESTAKAWSSKQSIQVIEQKMKKARDQCLVAFRKEVFGFANPSDKQTANAPSSILSSLLK